MSVHGLVRVCSSLLLVESMEQGSGQVSEMGRMESRLVVVVWSIGCGDGVEMLVGTMVVVVIL